MKTPKAIECPDCKGKGVTPITVHETGKPVQHMDLPCITCKGEKTTTAEKAAEYKAMQDMWCRCGKDHGSYHTMAGYQDIYLCNHCHKVTQTG